MTQNTQTTAERIFALIANNQQTIRTGSIKLIDHGRAANLIAAEIDRLTAERNEARAERDLAQKAWNDYQLYRPKPASEDALLKQLSDARAEVARVTRGAASDQAVYRSDVAVLKAEVERLRLPAEAWETQEHYDSLRVAPMADVLAADAAMKVAAARARKAANLKKLVAEQEQAAARARAARAARGAKGEK